MGPSRGAVEHRWGSQRWHPETLIQPSKLGHNCLPRLLLNNEFNCTKVRCTKVRMKTGPSLLLSAACVSEHMAGLPQFPPCEVER